MAYSRTNGHEVYYDENAKSWKYSDDNVPVEIEPHRACKHCGKSPTKDGHDFCIANLGRVVNACCGHGVGEGYIQFDNGITVRGIFKIERDGLHMIYRKKPVEIEAFQYDGDLKGKSGYYVPDWAVRAFESRIMYYGALSPSEPPCELFIKTLEGNHHVSVGDFVIQGVQGELYPCKPDIFEATYEEC